MTGILVASAISLMMGVSPQHCTTIAEHLAARPLEHRGQPLVLSTTLELLEVSWEELLAAGDVVVEGTVRPLRSYLSEDGCEIMTDYALTPRQAHRGQLPPATKPGELQALIVTTLGGEMVVSGVTVRYRFHQLAPFRDGQNVMLVLSRRAEGGYALAKGPYGAFELVNGRVKHLLRDTGRARFEDVDKTAFVDKVRRR